MEAKREKMDETESQHGCMRETAVIRIGKLTAIPSAKKTEYFHLWPLQQSVPLSLWAAWERGCSLSCCSPSNSRATASRVSSVALEFLGRLWKIRSTFLPSLTVGTSLHYQKNEQSKQDSRTRRRSEEGEMGAHQAAGRGQT